MKKQEHVDDCNLKLKLLCSILLISSVDEMVRCSTKGISIAVFRALINPLYTTCLAPRLGTDDYSRTLKEPDVLLRCWWSPKTEIKEG